MRKLYIFIGIIFTASVFSFGQSGVVTVCQVLSDLDKYRGEIVAVRGLAIGNAYHGLVLRDYETKGECPVVAKSGQRWPSGIRLSFPPINWSPPDGPLKFIPDSTVIAKFRKDIRKIWDEAESSRKYNICYMATFIGELRSRKDLFISISRDNSYSGNGYGQGGRYPAILHLKTIIDSQLVDLDKLNWR